MPTAASAITAAFTGLPAEAVTGRGTGVDDAAWRRKADRGARPGRESPLMLPIALDVLAKVGGLEIAGLAGVILAGAARRIPVIPRRVHRGRGGARGRHPEARGAALPHRRPSLGGAGTPACWRRWRLDPYLDLGMRLGEGTGAALGIGLARAAVAVLAEMATFKSAGVSEGA